MAAPRLSASTAGPLSEPKLMAEMLTTDAGRKAFARPCVAPRTLAAGTGVPLGAGGMGKAACLMIRYSSASSRLLSLPKPERLFSSFEDV